MNSVDTSNRSKQNARAQSSCDTLAAIKNGAAALSAAGASPDPYSLLWTSLKFDGTQTRYFCQKRQICQ